MQKLFAELNKLEAGKKLPSDYIALKTDLKRGRLQKFERMLVKETMWRDREGKPLSFEPRDYATARKWMLKAFPEKEHSRIHGAILKELVKHELSVQESNKTFKERLDEELKALG